MPVCIFDLGPDLLAIILLDLVRTWLVSPYDAPVDSVSGTRKIQRMNGISNQTRSCIWRYDTSHRVRFPVHVLLSHAFKDAWAHTCARVPISLHIELTPETGAKRQKVGEIMEKRISEMLQKFPSTTRLRLQCTFETMAVAILPSFSKFPRIRYINLKGTSIGNSSVAKLARDLSRINKHLIGINIQCTKAGDVAVEELAKYFPGLQTIACGGSRICTDRWRRRPTCMQAPVTAAVFKSLSELPELRVIDIEEFAIPPTTNEVKDSLHVLTQRCEYIEHLRCNVYNLSCGMDNIAKFKLLKSLDLEHARFPQDVSAGLTHVIENCKMLHTLKLRSHMLKDEVFWAMGRSQLKIIRIVLFGRAIDWRFESFEKLRECTDLVEVSLIRGHGCQFNHPDVAKFVGVAREISKKNTSNDTSDDENNENDTELFEREAHLGQCDKLPYIKV